MTNASWPVVATLVILALALAISAITDLLRRTIYDVVTLPALALVLLLLTWIGGHQQLVASIVGMVTLWLVPFIGSFVDTIDGRLRLRWAPERAVFGEGDAKLMAVSGAASGLLVDPPLPWMKIEAAWWPPFSSAFMVLVWMSVASGVQAILWLAVARVRGREKPVYVPMGLAIAVGTVLAFLLGVP